MQGLTWFRPLNLNQLNVLPVLQNGDHQLAVTVEEGMVDLEVG